MIERILNFGTAANFKTVMTAANLWLTQAGQTPIDAPIAHINLPTGSVYFNVVGTTYTITGTPPTQVSTANPGYWVRLRWNGDTAATVKSKTYAQLMAQLTAAGVIITDTNPFLADGTTPNPNYVAAVANYGTML